MYAGAILPMPAPRRTLECLGADHSPLHLREPSRVHSVGQPSRHLSPRLQAAIVGSAQDLAKAPTRGGDRKSGQAATLPFDSVADRAAQSGARDRTQSMADKVAGAQD